MRKYLVFYSVDNELKFERHTFDAMTDEEAWKELQKLEGARVYDMTRSDRNGQMLDMGDLVEDYNDEVLDGGWWSIVLTLPEEEERKLIGYQVLDVNADIPDGLFSFQVFRSEQDAKDFIEDCGLTECTIHEIYDGDIEEPSFLGRKQRTFGKNEYVMVYNDSEGYFLAVIEAEQEAEYEEDEVDVVPIKNGFADCDNRRLVPARDIYQYAEEKNCPRCGCSLCIEHHDEIDYPYFCPSCDENFYGIEVQ